VQPAHGRQQVGTERHVGPAAREQHVEHLGERLGDQVVGIRGGDQLAGEPRRGVAMPGEEIAVRGHVTTANARDQLGVAQLPTPGGHLVDNGHLSR
jgi:hypothetical protein